MVSFRGLDLDLVYLQSRIRVRVISARIRNPVILSQTAGKSAMK